MEASTLFRVAGPVPTLYIQVEGGLKSRETVADFNKARSHLKYAANHIQGNVVKADRLIFTERASGPDLVPSAEDPSSLDISTRGLMVLLMNEHLAVPTDLHLIFDVPGRSNSARAGMSANRATAFVREVAMSILEGHTVSDPLIAAKIDAEARHNRLFWMAIRELPRRNPHL